MRKNILFGLMFALLIATNVFYLFYVVGIRRQIEEGSEIAMNKVNRTLAENTLLRNNITLSQQGVCNLPFDLSVYSFHYDETGELSKIKKQKNTLVFRYTTLVCMSCVEKISDVLKKFQEENENIEVIVLATYRPNEELMFKSICKPHKNVYTVSALNLPLEKENVPYFFLLDKDLNVSNTFIPEAGMPKLTKAYLERIKELLP